MPVSMRNPGDPAGDIHPRLHASRKPLEELVKYL